MINRITFSTPIRSRDNDLYQECREVIRNQIFEHLPTQSLDVVLAMVVQDKDVDSVKKTVQSLLNQDMQSWQLHIIDDGQDIANELSEYHEHPRINIHAFDKPVMIPAAFLNVIFSYGTNVGTRIGHVTQGQEFKSDGLQQAMEALEENDIACGYPVLPGKDIGIHCQRPALFCTKSIYTSTGGFEERWSSRTAYDWEFIIQARKTGLLIDMEILTAERFAKLGVPAALRKSVESFREVYHYEKPCVAVIVDGEDAALSEVYLAEDYRGYENVEIMVEDRPGRDLFKMQDAIDVGAQLICRVGARVKPAPGWLDRLVRLSLSAEAGVYCEWEGKSNTNVIRNKGVKHVLAPYVSTECALIRKRFVEAYDLYDQDFEGAVVDLLEHDLQAVYTFWFGDYYTSGQCYDVVGEKPNRFKIGHRVPKYKTIRVLCSSDRQGKEVWWGDYWFKNAVVNALRAFGVKVVEDHEAADIDFFIHANKPDMRVRAPTKISWVVTRPGAASQQIPYFKNFAHVFHLSEPSVDFFTKHQIRSSYLHCGTTCEYNYDADEEKAYDFCMIGNTSKPRRIKLMEKLHAAGYKGAVYGTGWNKQSHLADFWKGFYWSNHDLRTLFNKSKLVVYCHWDEMRDKGLVAQRLLDICAMGAPVLTDNNVGLKKYGLDVPIYTTDQDFMDKMERYTRNDENWKQLVEQGKEYSRVARKSDFVVVAEEILKQLKSVNRI